MKKLSLFIILPAVAATGIITILYFFVNGKSTLHLTETENTLAVTPTALPTPIFKQAGSSVELPKGLQAFQTFNNCGPATLSMLLSYYQINVSQQELGKKLRPYQNPQGDNDDKSVTFEEMADEARNYDLAPYARPNGTIDTLKLFTANGIPVGVRTTLNPDDDIGHFRVVVGFDESTGEIIQDDSYHGPRLRYSYQTFLDMWQPYNYQYMVFASESDRDKVEAILGADLDERRAWQNTYDRAIKEQEQEPNDVYPQLNQTISLYYLEKYNEAVDVYEEIEGRLPFRTLWYQIEPIQAYHKLADYPRVFSLTDRILNNNNRAFSQLYIIRGDSYLEQGDRDAARLEYEKAVFYNQSLELAKERLSSVTMN